MGYKIIVYGDWTTTYRRMPVKRLRWTTFTRKLRLCKLIVDRYACAITVTATTYPGKRSRCSLVFCGSSLSQTSYCFDPAADYSDQLHSCRKESTSKKNLFHQTSERLLSHPSQFKSFTVIDFVCSPGPGRCRDQRNAKIALFQKGESRDRFYPNCFQYFGVVERIPCAFSRHKSPYALLQLLWMLELAVSDQRLLLYSSHLHSHPRLSGQLLVPR